MQIVRRLWLLMIVVLLSGCASRNIEWDYNTDQSLTGLKTYAWMTNSEEVDKNGYESNSLMGGRVHAAVDETLAAKGLRRLDGTDNADILVNYAVTVKTRLEDHQVTTSFGFGRNYWGVGFSNDSYVNEYEEGSLIIDFIDPVTKKVLWRGVSRSRIRNKMTPEERTQKVNTAVSQILAGYPRPVKK
ncbi:hypothetical protein ACH42_16360 [Endozoicomonas sp. (ex Bugula neritina AB1)]|nr:hypothetical protein ACH42_16360 [Endozoicomonas sp. (ex Bugula neritina AB1)]